MEQYFMDMEMDCSDALFSLLNGEDDHHTSFPMQQPWMMQYMPNKFANRMGRYRDSDMDDILRMRRRRQNIMRRVRDDLKEESELKDPFWMNRRRFLPPLFEGRNNNSKGKDLCYDVSEEEKIQARTIIVENLDNDYSEEKLKEMFRVVGSVKSIRLRNPCDPQLAGCSQDVLISEKRHAIVEYETSEAAKRADKKSWANGISVRKMRTTQ